MAAIPLANALGGMVYMPQFFIWKLTWLADKGKYEKVPCWPSGADRMNHKLPANWMSYGAAMTAIEQLRLRHDGYQYALGFYFTPDCGYWFIDIDTCMDGDGRVTPLAQWFVDSLPGACVERSSSGRGLHLFGRGAVPAHACKPPKGTPYYGSGVELYTEARGVAFGLDGVATGNADTDHGSALWHVIVPQIFPFGGEDMADGLDQFDQGPREDWRGPSDDEQLLRRAMLSKSVAAAFGVKASFADLWGNKREVLDRVYPGESEADAALASHLAFWTGCDAPRIERLMRMSGLARAKWDDHRTYLRHFTIRRACANQRDVLRDADTVPVVPMTPVTPDSVALVEGWNQRIMRADEDELRNTIIPAIREDRSIDRLDRERMAKLIHDRFHEWMITLGMPECRAMLQKRLSDDEIEFRDGSTVPEWANQHVYVLGTDSYYSLFKGQELSRTAFNAQYNRLMPLKDNGQREDAGRWCLERWGMATVDETMYYPGQASVFEYGGMSYANSYNSAWLPHAAENYSVQGREGIEAFLRNLWALVGQRQVVYEDLLSWMATCVQKPGTKIRFLPLIKGIQGDGKSLIMDILTAVLGRRNVGRVGTELICNSSGFSDWAHGTAITAIEEIKLTGKDRYRVYDFLKPYVSNSDVVIHPKGGKSFDIANFTNYIAFTNHPDAVPLADDDRRWWVIFSAFSHINQLAYALGLTPHTLGDHFKKIFDSLKQCAGEWRKWLLEYPISASFNPDGHAPMTDEKKRMRDSGMDDMEAIARDLVTMGAHGIGQQIISSACLTNALRINKLAEGIDTLKTTNVAHLLTKMGFSAAGVVWWNGTNHRVWVTEDVKKDKETMRDLLEKTRTS